MNSLENNITIWKNIHEQKLGDIPIPKISEFNCKILHNIVTCGMYLSKWKNIKLQNVIPVMSLNQEDIC